MPYKVISEAWLLEEDHVDQMVTEAAGLSVGIVCLSMACAATRHRMTVWYSMAWYRNFYQFLNDFSVSHPLKSNAKSGGRESFQKHGLGCGALRLGG